MRDSNKEKYKTCFMERNHSLIEPSLFFILYIATDAFLIEESFDE